MNVLLDLQNSVSIAMEKHYQHTIDADKIVIQTTKKEFEGDFTLVTFAFTKALRKNPEAIANELGEYLVKNDSIFEKFNVVKGFLNLSLSNDYWLKYSQIIANDPDAFKFESNGKKVLVEYASPNTNKPLHLGHVRNILLGWSIAQILEYSGSEVVKTQIVNDRGIAVCKSMYAWTNFAEGATPETAGVKPDHFVGRYYVEFEKRFQVEYKEWQETAIARELFEKVEESDQQLFFKSFKNKYFNEYSKIGAETKDLLLKWEAQDAETIALWEKMNNWVYQGFEETYGRMGVSFDTSYYESKTYLPGKAIVEEGEKKGVFFKKDDGSVWIDLTDEGMDQKLVIRSDGTSVYITQDLGTAHLRFKDHEMDSMVYVVGDEQDYHFQVLFKVLKRLGESYADGLHHLSYGMVDLPDGKMKSREGNVVDADDLIDEVIKEAKDSATERGELTDRTEEEKEKLYRQIGLAALKFFIIKVNPKRRMTFDPKESVDMQGQTGPYIQNAYVRIQSVLRKNASEDQDFQYGSYIIQPLEKQILNQLSEFKKVVEEAAEHLDPSHIAMYCYTLAKNYHRFYHDHRILGAESEEAKNFRIVLSKTVGNILKKGMNLLGIELPQYM